MANFIEDAIKTTTEFVTENATTLIVGAVCGVGGFVVGNSVASSDDDNKSSDKKEEKKEDGTPITTKEEFLKSLTPEDLKNLMDMMMKAAEEEEAKEEETLKEAEAEKVEGEVVNN